MIRHTPVRITGNGFFTKVPEWELGVPDVLALRNGIFYGFEVKQLKGKLSEHQVRRAEEIMGNGGKYIVIRSVDEAFRVIQEICGQLELFPRSI